MNLELIKNGVTSKVARQILVTKKNSPTIMFAGGVVGVVATTVLACKATLKLEEILDDAEKYHISANELQNVKYSEADRKKDHVLIYIRTVAKVTKLYAPAVGVGVLSIGALTGSHVALTRRNVALTAAYSVLDKGFTEYRARVREEYGIEKEEEIHYKSLQREVVAKDEIPSKEIQRLGDSSRYARFFDEYAKEWVRNPEYNLVFLKCQQNYANDMLRSRGHIFLNEVYDMLGLERSNAGAVVGWVISKDGGDNYVDFGIFDAGKERSRAFVNGLETSILLDFNVDGVIYDKI